MLRTQLQLSALTILCYVEGDQIRKLAPNHPLLIYQDKTLPEAEKRRILLEFFQKFGSEGMSTKKPSDEELVECFQTYRVALLLALIIEQSKQRLKLK